VLPCVAGFVRFKANLEVAGDCRVTKRTPQRNELFRLLFAAGAISMDLGLSGGPYEKQLVRVTTKRTSFASGTNCFFFCSPTQAEAQGEIANDKWSDILADEIGEDLQGPWMPRRGQEHGQQRAAWKS
jgi:hypothetical protein